MVDNPNLNIRLERARSWIALAEAETVRAPLGGYPETGGHAGPPLRGQDPQNLSPHPHPLPQGRGLQKKHFNPSTALRANGLGGRR